MPAASGASGASASAGLRVGPRSLPVALLLAAIGGALYPFGLAPFDLWWLMLPAIALLLDALWCQGPRRAFLIGWFAGTARYAVGTSWIYVSIHEHGNASPLLAGTMVALFSLFMGLFPALMALGFAALRVRTPAPAVLAFAACWVLLEWTLTWLLTGFPWLFAGYALLETPLRGLAPVTGVLGLTLLMVLTAGLLAASALRRRPDRPLVMLGGAVALCWILILLLQDRDWTRPHGPALRVALVQGAVPQDLKWLRASRQQIVDRYRSLSAPHWGADLILWPEAALTSFVKESGALLGALDRQGAARGTTLVTGIPDHERDPAAAGGAVFYNSALALGAGSGSYRKQRLVPFGEYVPLEGLLRGLIEFFDLPMSRSGSGPAGQAPLRVGALSAGMAICYEIAYPDLVRDAAQETNLLLTISNDTWFGDSIGPEQHLQIARMRALELGLPLARATNDGVTALVDAQGRISARLPRFEPGVLTGSLQPRTGTTPFAATGSWPTVLFAVLLVLASSLLPPWLTRRRSTP